MTVQSAQAIVQMFTTRVFATGVGTNADSLPTGILYLNGTSNAATVTVTNITTGVYKAAVTLPTLALNDEVELVITATVSGVTDSAVIWGDSKDILVDGSGDVTFNNTSITTVTGNVNGSVASVTGAVGSVTGLTASNLDATVSSRMATYTQPTGFLAATFPTGTVANTTNITAGTITTVSGNVLGSTGSVFGAVGSVTGNIGGSMAGSVVGSVGSVLTGGLIDLTTTTYGEPSGPVGATATLKDMLVWLKTLSRNLITQTATTETLFKDDGTTTISTSTDSDNGTTFSRGKWS